MFFEQLIEVYNFDNIPLLVSSLVTFVFGFWEYIYSFRLVLREGKAPFPIWMHTFYFAHDTTWAFRCFVAASKHDWHWFLLGTSVALTVWNVFEIFNLYMAIVVERQEIWGPYTGKTVTKSEAIVSVVNQIISFYALVNVLIVFMGEGSVLQWFALTNVLMAAGPGEIWRRRRSRDGTSVGLALVIVFGTINTFLPTSMFVLAMPQVFDHPWYYLTGVVFTGVSISNLLVVTRLPAKRQQKGGLKPIW